MIAVHPAEDRLEERVLAKLHDVKAKQKGESKDLGALPALEKAGSCTSNANLCAALFRAAGVPARIVSGYAVWGGPHQTHYIVEAWLPGSGWVPFESTHVRARWPWSQQANVSIVRPEDEDRSGLREG